MNKIGFKDYVPVFLFALLVFLSYLVLKPFLLSIFLGALLAYISFPVYRWLKNRIKNTTLSALIICIVILIVIIIPSIFFVNGLIQESYSMYILSKQKLSGGLFENCQNSFCNLIKSFSNDPQVGYQLQEAFKAVTSWVIKKGSDFLVSLPAILLNLFVMFFTLFYFLKEGSYIIKNIFHYIGMRKKKYLKIIGRLKEVIYSIIYGYLLIALMQGLFGTIGFFIFGVNSPLFWGAMMAILALIPFIGTGFIWVPASLWIFLEGIFQNSNLLIYKGIGLFVFCFIFVSSLDNFIRPKLIGDKAKIHPAIIMVGIFGGIVMVGPIGLIVGPLILSLTAIIIQEYISTKKVGE